MAAPDRLAVALEALADGCAPDVARETRERFGGGEPAQSRAREIERVEALSDRFERSRFEKRRDDRGRAQRDADAAAAASALRASHAAFAASAAEAARARGDAAAARNGAVDAEARATTLAVELDECKRRLAAVESEKGDLEASLADERETRALEAASLRDQVDIRERAAAAATARSEAQQALLDEARAGALAARDDARNAERACDARVAKILSDARRETEQAARLALRESKRALRREPRPCETPPGTPAKPKEGGPTPPWKLGRPAAIVKESAREDLRRPPPRDVLAGFAHRNDPPPTRVDGPLIPDVAVRDSGEDLYEPEPLRGAPGDRRAAAARPADAERAAKPAARFADDDAVPVR